MLFLQIRRLQLGGVLDWVKFLALGVRIFRLVKVRDDLFIAFFNDRGLVEALVAALRDHV